jgi:membrane-associated phospholipid phosphatase
VFWARLLAWVIAAVLTGWVAFSRVYEAQHHPTDVFAGLCLGMGVLGAAVLAIRPLRPSATATAPSIVGPRETGLTDSPSPQRGDRAPALQEATP